MTSNASLRLFSFLQSVESLLARQAPEWVMQPVQRQANYGSGKAWLVCPNGRGLLLHASSLTGGYIWLRAKASGPGGVVVERSVYGGSRGFDWDAAAEGIVAAWVEGENQPGLSGKV